MIWNIMFLIFIVIMFGWDPKQFSRTDLKMASNTDGHIHTHPHPRPRTDIPAHDSVCTREEQTWKISSDDSFQFRKLEIAFYIWLHCEEVSKFCNSLECKWSSLQSWNWSNGITDLRKISSSNFWSIKIQPLWHCGMEWHSWLLAFGWAALGCFGDERGSWRTLLTWTSSPRTHFNPHPLIWGKRQFTVHTSWLHPDQTHTHTQAPTDSNQKTVQKVITSTSNQFHSSAGL